MRVVMVRSIITWSRCFPSIASRSSPATSTTPSAARSTADGFLWAGGEAGQVYRSDSTGRVEQVTTLDTFNCGLAFSPDGDLFVCNPAKGIVRVRPADGSHDVFATHAGGRKITCANFGLFDREGNYWVTDSGIWMKRNGALLKFTPDGRGEVVAAMGYANGLALAADGRSLFLRRERHELRPAVRYHHRRAERLRRRRRPHAGRAGVRSGGEPLRRLLRVG
jgi:sugar lactone lactonase YvrE